MKRRAALVGTVAAAAGAGVAWWSQRPGADDELAPLWAQRCPRPDGGELALADWRGRPLVINFWASWCAPCVRELPALDAFHREQGERGWRVIALAIDGMDKVREFLGRVPVSMPVGVLGPAGFELLHVLGNGAGGLPFTVLVGRDARIVWRKLGELDAAALAHATAEAR